MTAEPLENAVEEIVNVLRAAQIVRNVPINPPESMNYETFILVYPFSGSLDIAPIGARKSLHSIAVDLLVKRTDIAKNFATLKTMIDPLSEALLSEYGVDGNGQPAGNQFNNAFNTFSMLTYNWITSDYGGITVVGYHFLMVDVKILVNL